MGQLPLARLPFGQDHLDPGRRPVAQLDRLGRTGRDIRRAGVAGAVPRPVLRSGVIIVLASWRDRSASWATSSSTSFRSGAPVILGVLFVLLTVKILQHGSFTTHDTVHGATAVATFVLVTTIAVSGSFSWASYAADYSRYQPEGTQTAPIFWWSLFGLTASYVWTYAIGVAGAGVLTNQTAEGVRKLVGGGFVGVLALLAIVFGAITSNSMNDYSGSLALQAGGIKVRRNWSALFGTVLAFFLILWIHHGDVSTRFQNVLLFSAYWIAPFLAIILIDWVTDPARSHAQAPGRPARTSIDWDQVGRR